MAYWLALVGNCDLRFFAVDVVVDTSFSEGLSNIFPHDRLLVGHDVSHVVTQRMFSSTRLNQDSAKNQNFTKLSLQALVPQFHWWKAIKKSELAEVWHCAVALALRRLLSIHNKLRRR